eukprot:3571402-Amphidinium_carterae.2
MKPALWLHFGKLLFLVLGDITFIDDESAVERLIYMISTAGLYGYMPWPTSGLHQCLGAALATHRRGSGLGVRALLSVHLRCTCIQDKPNTSNQPISKTNNAPMPLVFSTFLCARLAILGGVRVN